MVAHAWRGAGCLDTGKAQAIEDAVYDLKAVNPREKKVTDTRTPAQLLEAIADKGREVDAALQRLRSLLEGKQMAEEQWLDGGSTLTTG